MGEMPRPSGRGNLRPWIPADRLKRPGGSCVVDPQSDPLSVPTPTSPHSCVDDDVVDPGAVGLHDPPVEHLDSTAALVGGLAQP